MNSPAETSEVNARKKRRSRSKACIPCQKQKVRCLSTNDTQPCQRCEKRGIPCVFRRLPQYWKPNNDEALQINMAEDLRNLHAAINNILANRPQLPLGALRTRLIAPESFDSPSPAPSVAHPSPGADHQADALLDVSIKESESVEPLNQIPIKSLYEITRLKSLRSRQLSPVSLHDEASARMQQPLRDLVSEGRLSLDDAERLTQTFLNQTDHFLYGIASRLKDLHSIRYASSLLFTAICTVSALHEPRGESLFCICSSELRRLISEFVFAAQVSIEDFQGLCIASFWLSDMSWSVSGLAIRRAMEFQLARSFDFIVGDNAAQGRSNSRLPLSNPEDALFCLRMWYLFFICDRHLSILYGRPSTFGDEASVANWQRYLDAISETSTDVRLASQIDLLLILDQVIELFGTRPTARIPVSFQERIEGFNHQLDRWIITWGSRYEPHEQIGDFPAKALTLHYHFAKLFVSSHVFRGHSSRPGENPLPPEYHNIANIAVKSAKGIVDLITQDLDIRAGFVAMPHYYHTMIAYACSFLLRLATNKHGHSGIEQHDILDSIIQVTELCQSTQCTRYHIIHWMGSGLREIAGNYRQAMVNQPSNYSNNEERVPEKGINGNPEISTRQPNQETEVDMWDTVRQAATSRGGFLVGEAGLTDERGVAGDTMLVPDMGSFGLESQWEALLASFGG